MMYFMSVFGFSDGVIIGALIAASAILVTGALFLVARSVGEPNRETKSVPKERPLPLQHVLQEGFEIIEIYGDVATATTPSAAHPPVISCTAKVRDPESGAIRLLRVLTPTQRAR